MGRYTGVECPICHQELKETDEIVVCPQCGAPYHRHCFRGECIFQDLHKEGKTWEPPAKKQEQDFDRHDGKLRCSRCGTANHPGNIFCDVCGSPLHAPEGDGERPPAYDGGPYQNRQQGQQPPFGRNMAYNPFTTPYGGLDPDEEIDGIPVKDVAIYVGETTHYYLPKFKEMYHRKTFSWNWSAFFLDCYFMLYRKMYGWAIGTFLLKGILTFAAIFMIMMRYSGSAVVDVSVISLASNITYFISLGIMALSGFMTNRLYMKRCFRQIKKIRAESSDDGEYYQRLTKKGSVSRKAVLIVLAVYLVASTLMSFFMMYLTSIGSI